MHLIEGRRPLYQDEIQRPVVSTGSLLVVCTIYYFKLQRFSPTIKIVLDPPSDQSRARCNVPALQLEVTYCLRSWPKSNLKLVGSLNEFYGGQ